MGQCKKDVTPLLTHWSYVFLALTHRYVPVNPIGSGCSLVVRRQAIIWTDDGLLLIDPLGTNFSEICIKIQLLFQKIDLKMTTKWWPFCLGFDVLTHCGLDICCISDLGQYCHLFSIKPQPETRLTQGLLDPYEQTHVKFVTKHTLIFTQENLFVLTPHPTPNPHKEIEIIHVRNQCS